MSEDRTARLTIASRGRGRILPAAKARMFDEWPVSSLLEATPCTPKIRNTNQIVQKITQMMAARPGSRCAERCSSPRYTAASQPPNMKTVITIPATIPLNPAGHAARVDQDDDAAVAAGEPEEFT